MLELKRKRKSSKNYNLYADLLLKHGIKNCRELVEDKIYPYVVIHNKCKKTKELIWQETNISWKDFVGPKFKLYKLAIYLQDTNKNNGVTGFVPNFISPRFNRYLDTIAAYLLSFLSIHPRLSIELQF